MAGESGALNEQFVKIRCSFQIKYNNKVILTLSLLNFFFKNAFFTVKAVF